MEREHRSGRERAKGTFLDGIGIRLSAEEFSSLIEQAQAILDALTVVPTRQTHALATGSGSDGSGQRHH